MVRETVQLPFERPSGEAGQFPHTVARPTDFTTSLGLLRTGDCLDVLRDIPDETLDLVVTSPPYDGQPRYNNGERYEREWFEGFFLQVTEQILRVLKPHGSFVLNYRSKRYRSERGTLQFELVFWLRDQGFLFCEDFVWGKPSPPPGRFQRFLKDAVEYCFQFAKTQTWQFFPRALFEPGSLGRQGQRTPEEAPAQLCESE